MLIFRIVVYESLGLFSVCSATGSCGGACAGSWDDGGVSFGCTIKEVMKEALLENTSEDFAVFQSFPERDRLKVFIGQHVQEFIVTWNSGLIQFLSYIIH